MLQDKDVAAYLKLTTKEKLGAATKAAAAQKLLNQEIEQLKVDLKVCLLLLQTCIASLLLLVTLVLWEAMFSPALQLCLATATMSKTGC